MRISLLPVLLAASLAAGGAALAAEATGVVKSWDAKTHTLTLESGITYVLPSSFSAGDAFRTGEKVTISYDVKDGKNMATEAHMAS